jgi:hypothetical protein
MIVTTHLTTRCHNTEVHRLKSHSHVHLKCHSSASVYIDGRLPNIPFLKDYKKPFIFNSSYIQCLHAVPLSSEQDS